MACAFMEKVEKLNPACAACDTWVIFCRNPESSVYNARLTSRICTRKKCRFYTKGSDLATSDP